MADARRRSQSEDGIYFDHREGCRNSAHHNTCAGRWRGVVSLGFNTDGKRIRKKVSGQTKAEVRDKLKEVHSELDAGVRTSHGYTVEKTVADWLTEGLPRPPRRSRSTRRTGTTARGHRNHPAEGPDGPGGAVRLGEDGRHARDQKAAKGTSARSAADIASVIAGSTYISTMYFMPPPGSKPGERML
jgi:hypothetical protein